MKRIVCLLMCVLAAALACACGRDNTDPVPTAQEQTQAVTEAPTEAATEVPAAASTEAADALGLKAFISGFDQTAAVEEKNLYDKDDLSVTVTGIDYAGISGPGLQLSFENRGGRDVIIQAPYAVVNGFMIIPEMNTEVPSGKTTVGTLVLPYFNLAISNITTLKTIEFSLRVVEAQSYNPITKTDLIAVATSADDGKEADCSEEGQTVYDKDGVKLVLQGVNTDRAYSDGAELKVYMRNDTDSSIAVQTDEVIVNGYDMTSAMNLTLLPGKRAVDVVTFYKLDMEEYDIDEIDSVNVSFTLKNADSWETVDATDLISVELKQKETAPAATEKAE